MTVVSAAGEILFEVIRGCFANIGLEFRNWIGFASDGASTMVGEYNSVWSRLKQESPHCIRMKCICHSLSLCIQKAFDKLPSHLDICCLKFLNGFQIILRRDSYKKQFKSMDPGNVREGTQLPFQKLCKTRWFVRGKVICSILNNWIELKSYSTNEEIFAGAAVRYKIRMIFDMLNDEMNYLYFLFVSPIVTDFEHINALFQATDADPDTLVKDWHQIRMQLNSNTEIFFTLIGLRNQSLTDPSPMKQWRFGQA